MNGYRIDVLSHSILAVVAVGLFSSATPSAAEEAQPGSQALRAALDFPVLFTKRGNYQGIHIYDTCYQWHPGGGIYVLENPSDPTGEHRVRAVIDANTPETLGQGMYFDPDLSYDARKVVFCFKGEPQGSSSIYEIGIDGKGLRRITNPRTGYLSSDENGTACSEYHGRHGALGAAQDLTPAYLPDGKIVFTTMRHNGLVPCNNTGVAILHVMNPDGSDIHPISVNSETEFDPSMMLDGRILFGRWEYVDKTALTIQSLWSVHPDGTMETAVYANNMVFPEAVLDGRQVDSAPDYAIATFAKHNSTPRGTIALIDMGMGKNDPKAVFNFSDPANPLRDTGNACEPYPITRNLILFSDHNGRKNALYLARRNPDDTITRELVFQDGNIDCHSPMPVRPRPVPRTGASQVDRSKDHGYFMVQDVYEGMPEVPRGSVKKLRVIEETSRVSKTPGGGPFNQTFTISAALAWTCKNYLGEVPVEEDGSAFFEVPAGKMVYLQALDGEGRSVRSMRTFIQAAPGSTRACIGCHENKKMSFSPPVATPIAHRKPPARPRDESWGSGVLDYPTMVQPVLDKHCAECHGGEKGFAAGLDLTGGWTEYFNNSYENLVSRREVQYKSTLIAGVCSMNGTSHYSAKVFAPNEIGSAAAPLAKVVVEGALGHDDSFEMSRAERDLILAWIDGNGPYHGTWNYTPRAFRLTEWQNTKTQLVAEMKAAGCLDCHDTGKRFENDWFNFRQPELSRILRAPLAKGGSGLGEELCRQNKVDGFRRLRVFSTGRYEHAVKPLKAFPRQQWRKWDKGEDSGKPVVSFADSADPHYRKMLEIIRAGSRAAQANPRIDMPRAEEFAIAGKHRNIYPVRIPAPLPAITAEQIPGGEVAVRWGLTSHTWGLSADVYRGDKPGFEASEEAKVGRTELGSYIDRTELPSGEYFYAVVFNNGKERSAPARAEVTVQPPKPPPVPAGLKAEPVPGGVELSWTGGDDIGVKYQVYRRAKADGEFAKLTASDLAGFTYVDSAVEAGKPYAYTVRSVSRRGTGSELVPPVTAAALPEIRDALFTASFAGSPKARLYGGDVVVGEPKGNLSWSGNALDLQQGGHVTYAHRPEFDLSGKFSMKCRVKITKATQMPVIVSCGSWNRAGWFLQRIGSGWRWHVGGIDCDGGAPAPGKWTELACTFDGQTACLYQDGRLVRTVSGVANRSPWTGHLHIGQYSGGPGDHYQVLGQVSDVGIYGCVLNEKDLGANLEATGHGGR